MSHHHVHPRASAPADVRRLAGALGLIVGLMAVEVVVRILASSLALLSDAGHMLTDAGAIGMSLVAARLAARPARGAMTYGLGRAEILSAQANGVTLLVLAALIAYEGVRRLASPPDVHAWPVLAVALAGVRVEAAPEGAARTAIGRALGGRPGVGEAHALHIGEVPPGSPPLPAHVLVGRDTDCHEARRSLEHLLHTAFDIEHTTLQVEHE